MYVYLASDCVICNHRKFSFLNSIYTKPSNSAIRGKIMHHFIKFVLTKL